MEKSVKGEGKEESGEKEGVDGKGEVDGREKERRLMVRGIVPASGRNDTDRRPICSTALTTTSFQHRLGQNINKATQHKSIVARHAADSTGSERTPGRQSWPSASSTRSTVGICGWRRDDKSPSPSHSAVIQYPFLLNPLALKTSVTSSPFPPSHTTLQTTPEASLLSFNAGHARPVQTRN